jgi:ABC-type dipeptide/oligopeptide/nickel transport system permease subunit
MAALPGSLPTYDFAAARPRPGWHHRLLRMTRQHPDGAVGLLVLAAFVTMAVAGPSLAPFNPREISVGTPYQGPSGGHWFGTNTLGQDVFSRVVAGARISLLISTAAIVLGGMSGAYMGIVSGYYGGWLDYLIQRSGEAFSAFPAIVLYLLLITAFGRGVDTIIVAIAIGALFGGSRTLRAATIVERHTPYVEAARSLGCRETRVFARHVVPNVLPLTIVLLSTSLGAAILAESALAFLGIGLEPGTPSWGVDMSGENLTAARFGNWHLVVFPGLAISLVVLAANLVGDALRDILDPRLRQ